MTLQQQDNSSAPQKSAPLKIAAVYALVGCLWILLSDKLLAFMVRDQETITNISIYKGWIYVVASALLIYFLVGRALKKAEKARDDLRESETRFRLVMDKAVDAIFLHDEQGRILDVNQAACESLGYSREELLRMRVQDLDPRVEADNHRELLWEQLYKEKSVRFDTQHQRKDGTLFPVEVNLGALHLGERRLFLALARDITERRRAENALRESEEKRRVVLDESSDPIFSFEPDGTYRFVNRAFATPFGKKPEDIIGKKIWDIFSPEEAQRRFEVVRDVFEHGETRVIEVQVPLPSGSLHFVTSAKPVKDDRGDVISVICISKDITARIRSEEALKESEERFRVLSEESPLGISLISAEDRYEYLNPAFIKMFGYTLADIPTGEDWFRLAYPDPEYRRQVMEAWREDLRTHPAGESRQRTYQVQCRDGASKTVLFMPVTISSGRQFIIYADITERLRAEEAQRESERRYRELFDSIDDFIYTHDMRGNILTINKSACRSIGYSSEELVGRCLCELLSPELRRAFFDEYLTTMAAEGQMTGVTKYLSKEGHVRYIEFRNKLVREEGKEPYVSGAGRDVTERVLAERELRRLEEQLFRAQKIEALGVLAGGIAHDFNNVLQAISGHAQLMLAESKLSPAGRERLESIGRSIERAARMIKQLMTLAHKVETRRERVDLNREVRQTISILEHTMPRMINIRADLAPGLKSIGGDSGQIEQVLLNLATNSGHAMPSGGELSFHTRNVILSAAECKLLPGLQPGEHVKLEIADTGLGMDEEVKSHIFEPFFTTKPPGEGTGLGLSTVYGIVTNHGGQILCKSQPGKGTVFTIYFPVAAYPGQPASADTSQPGPIVTGSEIILLVDDEEAILDSCKEALQGSGYQVLTALNGDEALSIFMKDPGAISLVVMDLNMPGMGGLECMKMMLAASPRTKIMVATGYADQGMEEKIADMGGMGLISKPYSFAGFLSAVRSVLDKEWPASPGASAI